MCGQFGHTCSIPMLNRDDILDIVWERLFAGAGDAPMLEVPAAGPLHRPLQGRLFLSEYDIKKKLKNDSRKLTIPQNAILSPLVVDWLALRRIMIVRE